MPSSVQAGPVSDAILAASQQLSTDMAGLTFPETITHCYNPLEYAWPMWETYVRRFASGPREVLFLGMNPGPWGMAQTGVPFGEVAAVRDWLKLQGEVGKPPREHLKKPVTGLTCHRSEVSGQRLWGLFRERFGTPEAFFARHFVHNYCPLLLTAATEKTAPNVTPDKLPAVCRQPLYAACDAALRALVSALQPKWLIGVGQFAEQRAREALGDDGPRIARMLHPSPASPAANRDFAGTATRQLEELGVW
ncbi:MAG: uracil-DNA glycosylase family protein [Opitutales bacterium]